MFENYAFNNEQIKPLWQANTLISRRLSSSRQHSNSFPALCSKCCNNNHRQAIKTLIHFLEARTLPGEGHRKFIFLLLQNYSNEKTINNVIPTEKIPYNRSNRMGDLIRGRVPLAYHNKRIFVVQWLQSYMLESMMDAGEITLLSMHICVLFFLMMALTWHSSEAILKPVLIFFLTFSGCSDNPISIKYNLAV